MERIGMVTVGQAPRDDLVPFMTPFFTRPVDVLQAGAYGASSDESFRKAAAQVDKILKGAKPADLR